MKTDKTHKKQEKITPASHGDELDVLEALYWIEKKNDKQLLSDSQRKKLLNSKRIEEHGKTQMLKDDAIKTSYRVISSVLKSLDKYKKLLYSRDSWDNFDKEGKMFARKELFQKIYGVSSKEMGYAIFLNMLGAK